MASAQEKPDPAEKKSLVHLLVSVSLFILRFPSMSFPSFLRLFEPLKGLAFERTRMSKSKGPLPLPPRALPSSHPGWAQPHGWPRRRRPGRPAPAPRTGSCPPRRAPRAQRRPLPGASAHGSQPMPVTMPLAGEDRVRVGRAVPATADSSPGAWERGEPGDVANTASFWLLVTEHN